MPEATGPRAPAADAIEATAEETLTFEAERAEAGRIDAWIETVGKRWGTDEKTIFGARLCVAELFANTLEHGGAKSGRDRITVTLARRRDGLGIAFLDTCAPFDPTAWAIAEQPDSIDAVTASGRGLRLIRAYAAEFAYRRDGTCNRITLGIKSTRA